MYCGDETGAFIGDVGSHTARFGYGGEDCPKVVVPSAAYHTSSHSSSTTAVTGSDDGRGIINSSTLANKGRGKYSAPVSLMRIPPETFEDNDGFVPIYSSLNSNDNNQQQQNSNTVSNNDGLIQDIDAWASLWEYSYSALCVRGKGKHTRGHKYHHQSELPELQPEEGEGPSKTISSQSNIDGPTIDHPLLAVDSTSRTNIPSAVQEKQRAQMLETLFESLSAPAAYIAPSAMLSSFAYGRQTSLVVDVGHSGSRVTPIVDGYCLTNGSVSSERGGRWLGNVQQSVLEGGFKNVNGTVVNKWNGWGDSSSSGSPPCRDGGIIPRYALHSNTKKCSKNKLQLLKQSPFHSMAVHEVMYEMMSSSHIVPLENSKEESPPFCGYGEDGESMVVENNDNDTVMEEDKKEEDEDEDDIDEGPCYVLPDGTRVDLAKSKAGKDLCRLPELLFSDTLPSFMQSSTTEANNNNSNTVLPIHQLIHKSLNDILDVDLRKELSSNIILTGGASLIPTLDKRLSVELGEVLPSSYKYKVIGSKNTLENRYSAWIGGSILSSLGSFQQLWLSKEEYEECGAVLGLQRFKC